MPTDKILDGTPITDADPLPVEDTAVDTLLSETLGPISATTATAFTSPAPYSRFTLVYNLTALTGTTPTATIQLVTKDAAGATVVVTETSALSAIGSGALTFASPLPEVAAQVSLGGTTPSATVNLTLLAQ